MHAPDNPEGDVYVSPRYLAGFGTTGDASFEPVADWPHHYLDDGPCQTLITSPDHRIRIGWFGDDYDVWQISAAEDAVSPARWSAYINQNTPPEITRGLTSALAAQWAEDSDSFLTSTSLYWTDAVRPLLDAGWERRPPSGGKVEIVSPDQLAGATIDVVNPHPDAEKVTLWAGPAGWGTRAEAVFTARTPQHLIAATAATFLHPTPVARYQENLNPRLARLAQFTPVTPPTPTPLDVHRTAAHRRPPALSTRSIPRWSTTSLPPALAAARPGSLRR